MLQDLVDDAAAIAGSKYKLSQLLNKPPGRVYLWKLGTQLPTPEDIVAMAMVAGRDPFDALAHIRGGFWVEIAQVVRIWRHTK
jgi:hypothetical protein